MGDQRTYVTFEAVLPNDTVFAETGDVSVPGGYNICEALVQSMQPEGVLASDIKQHDFYGWQFTFRLDGTAFWVLLQWIDPWLLIIENRSGKSGVFRRSREPSASATTLIDDVLKRVPEFSTISWFTRSEFESGARVGNPRPL